MKKNEQSNFLLGIILMIIAAFCVISLMLHLLSFTNQESGAGIQYFGAMIFTVYGYSSFLIPIYLFTTAILLFYVKNILKTALFLVFSIIPFFSVVFIEYVSKSIFTSDDLNYKIMGVLTFLLISILIVSIEYLVIALIVEKFLWVKHDNIEQNKTLNQTIDLETTDLSAYGNIKESPLSVTENADELAFLENPLEHEIEHLEEAEDPIAENELAQEINSSPHDDKSTDYSFDYVSTKKAHDTIADTLSTTVQHDDPQPITPSPIDLTSKNTDNAMQLIDDDEDDGVSEPMIFSYTDDDTAIHDSEKTHNIQNIDEVENDVIVKSDKTNEIEHDKVNPDETFTDITEDSTISEIDTNEIDSYNEEKDEIDPKEENFDYDTMNYEDLLNDFDDDEDNDDNDEEIDDNNNDEDTNDDTEDNLPFLSLDFTSTRDLDAGEPPVFKKKFSHYQMPDKNLLADYEGHEYWVIDEITKKESVALKNTLNEFKIEAEITGIRKGPVVTMFEILPAPGVRLNKIVALSDNIALRLAASSVRIVAPIPGKHAVGIEVPNKERAIVSFKELLDSDTNSEKKMAVPVMLGKNIEGASSIVDLAKMPHLLIAGATGAGKSVCVNTIILSILYKKTPNDVKMILIDPKIVELKLYNDIPHLLTPVITEAKKAFQALQYCLCEMERRYALLDSLGVRDIASYNRRIKERKIATEKLPYIVIIIDEFADLMATTGKELESTVARLAAMSRAVGLHLVLATQRPSIDVITGLIKANIPSRIAFMVASKMDSRIIIDQVGAEKLLGKGDMLFSGAVDPYPVRLQGTFVSDTEVENVVEYVKQWGEPDYIDDEIFFEDDDDIDGANLFSGDEDPLYDKAVESVMQAGKASASYIQRRLKIGYNRAARLIEDMEARGIVGPPNGSKPREILHVV